MEPPEAQAARSSLLPRMQDGQGLLLGLHLCAQGKFLTRPRGLFLPPRQGGHWPPSWIFYFLLTLCSLRRLCLGLHPNQWSEELPPPFTLFPLLVGRKHVMWMCCDGAAGGGGHGWQWDCCKSSGHFQGCGWESSGGSWKSRHRTGFG